MASASRDEWYANKLANLVQEDLRVSTLSELRDHLKSLPHDEAAKIASDLQLPLVFDCLNDTNTEQVDLACEVLSLCLGNLHLGESTIRYRTAFERALIHPFPVVKLMALNEIGRSISDEEVLCGICEQSTLLSNIIFCLGDSDLAVAKKASDVLVAVGTTLPGANKITSNDLLVFLEDLLSQNEVVRLRIFEMIVLISKESEYSFRKLKSVGLMSKMFDELENNDILLRLNVIEILSNLAQSEHGFRFLEEMGVLNKLLSQIVEDEVTSQLYEPGILRFFGHIGNRKPQELLVKYPTFFDHLFSNIESSNLTIIGISLDTIGYIGQTAHGKLALDSTGRRIEGVIKSIAKLLNSLPTEIRVRALNCIENLLRNDRYDLFQITEKWSRLLGADPIEVISKYAKNPFSELRLAGLGILNAIAGQPWGQEAIKNSPGLVEFLLDRSVETIKECKEAKYEIVKLLNVLIFDQHMAERIREFVKEGPFYVQTVTEVAIEGN